MVRPSERRRLARRKEESSASGRVSTHPLPPPLQALLSAVARQRVYELRAAPAADDSALTFTYDSAPFLCQPRLVQFFDLAMNALAEEQACAAEEDEGAPTRTALKGRRYDAAEEAALALVVATGLKGNALLDAAAKAVPMRSRESCRGHLRYILWHENEAVVPPGAEATVAMLTRQDKRVGLLGKGAQGAAEPPHSPQRRLFTPSTVAQAAPAVGGGILTRTAAAAALEAQVRQHGGLAAASAAGMPPPAAKRARSGGGGASGERTS